MTDRWTDRQKKSHIEVGAPPKKTRKANKKSFFGENKRLSMLTCRQSNLEIEQSLIGDWQLFLVLMYV